MRKHFVKLATIAGLALLVALFMPQRAAADDDDPPARVARLALVSGSVSFQPSGTDDWVSAVPNRPMTTGDKLWSDANSRAEMHIGSASIRIGATTGFSFLNLDDNVTQIQLTEGSIRVRVKRLEENETFEIDTPNLAFSVLRPGTYRVDVNEAGDTTVVSVRGGEGEVTGGGQAFTVNPEQSATFTGTDQITADVEDLAQQDDFDSWCATRDHREDVSESARYVAPDVIGTEDLDDNGVWNEEPDYGHVWFPRVTVVGWAPYHYGHWAYIAPWGYTWVDDAPWGFAPFHYGRWVSVRGAWGWIPAPAPVVGVVYVRPVYAPALVAWVGGPHFAIGVGVGGGFAAGVNVGWFPLGPREVFVPSYAVSRAYVTRVNVTNTRVETTVVNNYYNNVVVNKTVTNVTYVNQRVPGAVVATTPAAFTSAQPVSRNFVRVDAREVASAPVVARTPAVVPQRQAVLGVGASARVRPPAAIAARAVVAKTAPPPPPPSFEKRQAAIQQNGGRPIAASQARQLAPVQTRTASSVRIAPPAKQVAPQKNNASNRGNFQPGNRPSAPATSPANSGQPGNAAHPPAAAPNQQPAAQQKSYNDRPPASRPTPANNPPAARQPANNQLEQKQQEEKQLQQKQQEEKQQLQRQQQEERQKVQQQQEAEHQQLQKQQADERTKQQTEQKHQQQLNQLNQKHAQEQERLQQRQQQERNNAKPEKEKPKNDKPPKEKPNR